MLVGVCDTGIWRYAGAFHPQWLYGSYSPQVDDETQSVLVKAPVPAGRGFRTEQEDVLALSEEILAG